MQTVNNGESEQEALQLLPWTNPAPARAYRVEIKVSTFTCLCPLSGAPDYARLLLAYVPNQAIVELKSLKLYLESFRSTVIGHEAVVNRILDDLVDFLQPQWLRVIGDFAVRGGFLTVITAEHCSPYYTGPQPPSWWAPQKEQVC